MRGSIGSVADRVPSHRVHTGERMGKYRKNSAMSGTPRSSEDHSQMARLRGCPSSIGLGPGEQRCVHIVMRPRDSAGPIVAGRNVKLSSDCRGSSVARGQLPVRVFDILSHPKGLSKK